MLSIIIPVRNSESIVVDCLESVLQQNISSIEIEVLISDNCSTDGTLRTLNSFQESFKNKGVSLQIFAQETNLGAFGNLNFLLEHCRFKHAHILCADDIYSSPDSVTLIQETLLKHPSVSIFSFDNDTCHREHNHWRYIFDAVGDSELAPRTVINALFTFGCFLGGLSNICINREHFRGNTYFDPDYTYFGDIQFYARAAINGATVFLLREEITTRREHSGSISSTQNPDNVRSHESISTTAALFNHLVGMGVKPKWLRAFASGMIAQFYHRGVKTILTTGNPTALIRVMNAQKDSPAFYPPLLHLALAVILRLPMIRRWQYFDESKTFTYLESLK